MLFGVSRVLIALFVVELVPVLLSVLSIVFGPKLRQASYQVRAAGERAVRRLDGAEAEFQDHVAQSTPRVRVDATPAPGPRVRVGEGDSAAEAREAEVEREAAEVEREAAEVEREAAEVERREEGRRQR